MTRRLVATSWSAGAHSKNRDAKGPPTTQSGPAPARAVFFFFSSSKNPARRYARLSSCPFVSRVCVFLVSFLCSLLNAQRDAHVVAETPLRTNSNAPSGKSLSLKSKLGV